jgi:hypothetical protein
MKNYLLITFIALTMLSCGQAKQQSDNQTTDVPQKGIGGDRDENGCLTGAGQTWSQLAKTCIQVFKEAKRLNPIVKKDGQAVISAFVLMNEDASVCELFLPYGDKTSILLPQTSEHTYVEGDYRYDSKTDVLYVKDEAAYKEED